MIVSVPLFAIAFFLLDMHQSSPTGHPVLLRYPVGLGDQWWQFANPPVMTVRQSTSDEWNWCISTCRVFETRIFVSSNFKKWENKGFTDEIILYAYLW